MPNISRWPEPQPAANVSENNDDVEKLNVQQWVAWSSWTFCPDCGRKRANGKLDKTWQQKGASPVQVRCKGGCDPAPTELAELKPEPVFLKDKTDLRLLAYVTHAQDTTEMVASAAGKLDVPQVPESREKHSRRRRRRSENRVKIGQKKSWS